MEVVRLCAPQDGAGNPRRVFLVIEAGEVVHAIDEGYRGHGALKEYAPGAQVAAEITVTAGEYNAWKRQRAVWRAS